LHFANDAVVDYAMFTDTITHRFICKNKVAFSFTNNNTQLQSIIYNQQQLQLQPTNWQQSPLLQPDFHWTVDAY
jgi:hypothetical protein